MSSTVSTQEKILTAFMMLIEKKLFSSIRVTDIIVASEVSRQTFYRLYVNKYTLAKKFFCSHLSAAATICGKKGTIKDIMMAILKIIKNNPKMYSNLLRDPEGARLFPEILRELSQEWTGFSPAWATTIINSSILIEWANGHFLDSPEVVYYSFISSLPAYELLSEEELKEKIKEYEKLKDKDFFPRQHVNIHKK